MSTVNVLNANGMRMGMECGSLPLKTRLVKGVLA